MAVTMDVDTLAQPVAEAEVADAGDARGGTPPGAVETKPVEAAASVAVEEEHAEEQQSASMATDCEGGAETLPAREQQVEFGHATMVEDVDEEKLSPEERTDDPASENQPVIDKAAEEKPPAEDESGHVAMVEGADELSPAERTDDLAADAQPVADIAAEEKSPVEENSNIPLAEEHHAEASTAPTAVQMVKPQSKLRGANLKRKREVDNLTRKAERLEREAHLAEHAVKEEAVAVEALAEELRKRQAALKKREEGAAAARRAATKARNEVSFHELPKVRPSPRSPFTLFVKEIQATLADGKGSTMGRCAELWKQLSPEQKQKYRDMFDEQVREYRAWESSEEGRAILAKRQEVLRMQGQVAETNAPITGAEPSELVPEISPAKRSRASEPTQTPIKTRSKLPVDVGPAIDEAVLVEACKLSLKGQLLNLASRPEVQALKKTSQELFEALKANGGMVNAAKRHLLADVEGVVQSS